MSEEVKVELLTAQEEDLVNFLTRYGFNRNSVVKDIKPWMIRQEKMDSYCSFKDQIILSYLKKKGRKLSSSQERYLNELNTALVFLDPMPM